MSNQDLQLSLIGKDVSASDALFKLAKAASQAARSAGDSLDSMNRRVESSSQNSLRSVTGSFGSGLMSWAQSGLAGILGGITASVTSSVMNVVGQAGDMVISQLKSSVIDYNSTLENATIGFTTMLGSGKAATGFLNQLQNFALKTPFDTENLINLSQQMMGYGIAAKDVIPNLTALGDAAAASGKTSSESINNIVLAFEQMHARGRVDLGDINQLTAGGVPALKILAAQYHTTTGGILAMIHSGKLMADDALPKLTAGIEKGTSKTAALGGMMEKQSTTFSGAMSNIKDALNRSLSSAFKPFYTEIEKGAVGLQKFTSSKQFQKWATDTGKTMSGWMKQIGGAFKQVFDDPTVQKSLKTLGTALSDAFKSIGPALTKILPNLVKFGKEALPGIISGITSIVKHVPEVISAIVAWSGWMAKMGPTISNVIKIVSNFIGYWVDLGSAVIKAGVQVMSAVSGIANNVTGFFAGATSWLAPAGGNIIQGLINGMAGMATSAINAVINIARGVVNGAKQFLGIQSPSKVFAEIGHFVGEGLNKGLLGSVDQIKSTSTKLASAITDQFKAGNISKSVENSALNLLKQSTDGGLMLQTLAKRKASLTDQINTLKSSRTGVHDDTLAATLGSGDITSFGAPGDAVRGLQQLVSKTKTFTADLKKLVGKGVKGTLLTQLVDGWNSDPDTALSTAQGLLANPTDLKQILSYQSQLDTAGRALGAYAGHAEYDSTINSKTAQRTVASLEMQKLANTRLKQVASIAGIHIHLSGTYAGTTESLAKTVTAAIKDAVKKGQLPKNILTAL